MFAIDEQWKTALLADFMNQLIAGSFGEASPSTVPKQEIPHESTTVAEEVSPTQGHDDPPGGDSFFMRDRYATGQKYAFTFNDQNLTGNMIASLKALRMNNGYVDSSSELESLLRADGRFELELKDDTIRAQLRSLTKIGLVKAVDQSARRITPIGEKIADLFDVIAKRNVDYNPLA